MARFLLLQRIEQRVSTLFNKPSPVCWLMDSPSSSRVCTDLTRYCHNCCFDSLIPSSVCCCGFGWSFSKCTVLWLAHPWLSHPLRTSKKATNKTKPDSAAQPRQSVHLSEIQGLHCTIQNEIKKFKKLIAGIGYGSATLVVYSLISVFRPEPSCLLLSSLNPV